jgi:hypothetical protein
MYIFICLRPPKYLSRVKFAAVTSSAAPAKATELEDDDAEVDPCRISCSRLWLD